MGTWKKISKQKKKKPFFQVKKSRRKIKNGQELPGSNQHREVEKLQQQERILQEICNTLKGEIRKEPETYKQNTLSSVLLPNKVRN